MQGDTSLADRSDLPRWPDFGGAAYSAYASILGGVDQFTKTISPNRDGTCGHDVVFWGSDQMLIRRLG